MAQNWMRLDNAAKIFPAVRRRNWSNVFRTSATLTEPVDPAILQKAVEQVRPRFPSMMVSLHRGAFWFYLQKLPQSPAVGKDGACPLIHMTVRETETCAIRVLYYQNRIAVEYFHALTDGTGGMVFLKTLVAAYLRLRYGIFVPCTHGVLDPEEAPRPEELEDSFLKYSGRRAMSRREPNALRLPGRREPGAFLRLTVGTLSTQSLLDLAHSYNCSITCLLTAVMLQSILDLAPRRRGWAKVMVPVNLRKLFGSQTLRNFALTLNVGVDPRLGTYSLQELCKIVRGQLDCQVNRQQMAARIAANVNPERNLLMKAAPLPLKNLVMRLVYRFSGESKGSINVSNLGLTQLPGEMAPYVSHLDFIIGPQATFYHNCSVVSYEDCTRINLIRATRNPNLEQRFFTRLVELGLEVEVQSNHAGRERP